MTLNPIRRSDPLNSNETSTSVDPLSKGKLGTFSGVFTPSVLTILGIILFLRLGFVVGSAGFGRALLVIAIANLISVLTSVSLAAIATNIRVKGGGDYYLISRTLGVHYGGALGLVLFLAQSVSIAFYCIGFGEAITNILAPSPFLTVPGVAVGAMGVLFVFAWMGADWATRFQYGVMVLLILSLVSFFWGGISQWEYQQVRLNWAAPEQGMHFWVLFAIFFPAVTGFTQGVSMSGDLKDPGKSLPAGTFLAVGISMAVYFGVAAVFAGALPNSELSGDPHAMKRIAFSGPLISAGVIAATLSSAMASFLGAPRILQSLARDKIFSLLNPFAKGKGASENPRRGVLLSAGIALITVSLGQLDIIARVVSMFFLISYGLLNYATFFEARASSPSFRPTFRFFNPWISLAGFLACAGVMLAIDVTTGVIAILILTAIYQYLRRTAGPSRWADSRRSHYLQRIRENMRAAADAPEHSRDWRPVIMAFTNSNERLERLIRFAGWLEGGSGITAAIRLIEGQGVKMKGIRQEVAGELLRQLHEVGSDAYPLAINCPDFSEALPPMIQTFGIGPVKANTGLIHWMDALGRGVGGAGALKYAENLRIAHRNGLNIVILAGGADQWDQMLSLPEEQRRIMVWWQNDATSRLNLLFAYLLTRDDTWKSSEIVLVTAGSGENAGRVASELKQYLEDVRIGADPVIVQDFSIETIQEVSKKVSLVFMPFRIRNYRVICPEGESLGRLLPRMPMTALVMAAEEIELKTEPDTGIPGELALAADILAAAEKRAKQSEREAQRLKDDADRLTDQLSGLSPEDVQLDWLVKASDDAIEEAEKAFRRAAKARAKAEDAARSWWELGQKTDSKDRSPDVPDED